MIDVKQELNIQALVFSTKSQFDPYFSSLKSIYNFFRIFETIQTWAIELFSNFIDSAELRTISLTSN
jgi:hypothetical protein